MKYVLAFTLALTVICVFHTADLEKRVKSLEQHPTENYVTAVKRYGMVWYLHFKTGPNTWSEYQLGEIWKPAATLTNNP